MSTNLLTDLFLPLALGIIMLGMGMSLVPADFKRVLILPKPIFAGLMCQLLLLPAVAFILMWLIPAQPEFAVGVILLAVCPGGATSNLLTYLARGDAALSVSLTAFSSLATIISIPFIMNIALETFMGEGRFVPMPVLQTMVQIMIITIIPIGLGMYLRAKKPKLAIKSEKPVKIASAIFITIIILGAVFRDLDNLIPYFKQAGFPALLLNLIMLMLGYTTGRLLRFTEKQSATLSIESGIQNGTLAIAIATSTTLLNDPLMAIPPAVYSLIMFVTGGLAVLIFQRRIPFSANGL